MKQGTVLRIEKISPHDGHGLRTVVFLKGCPLRCAWCSTPESQSVQMEWFYKQAKCRHCGHCLRACPSGALSVSADRTAVVRDPSKCTGCFACARACLSHAIGIYGQKMTVEQVMKEIRKESLFYFCSGGGVTLSGGDILLQADFAQEILKECREDGLHTMAELDMYGPYENVAKLLPYLKGYFADIKLIDCEAHKRWTGVDNTSILQNIRRAAQEYPQVRLHARVPLIPGINDTRENIQATADFCAALPNCKTLEFLPYHRLGASAYESLCRQYALADLPPMSLEEARGKVMFLKNKGYPFVVQVSGQVI